MKSTGQGGGTLVPEILFASCHARGEGAAVWGSFHGIRSVRFAGVPGVADWHGLHKINRTTKTHGRRAGKMCNKMHPVR